MVFTGVPQLFSQGEGSWTAESNATRTKAEMEGKGLFLDTL